jgi:hypothetical protein
MGHGQHDQADSVLGGGPAAAGLGHDAPAGAVAQKLAFMVGHADLLGTSLQGYLVVPFSRIVEVFGEPTHLGSGDGKVAFEWAITFADGTVASIYDYKSSSLYDPENPTPEQMRATDFDDWHIGGRSKRASQLVREALTS